MTRHRLNILDRAFFMLESDEAPCHVGLLAIFTPPTGAGTEFVHELVSSMREQREVAPPFNYQLARHQPPVMFGPWQELPQHEVDLDYHFRHSALPRPGSQRELGVLIARLHSRPLDPSRPLWELHIIEGLADGRFAMYFKVHHALMDGMTGTGKFAQSLSNSIDDGAARALWTVGRRTTPVARESALKRAVGGAKVLAAVGKSAVHVATKPSALVDPDRAVPFLGPVSKTLNGRISRQRRVVTQTYELARLKAVAKGSGVSLNDVYLAVCAGALRRYLDEIGERQTRSLTGGVPVSLRQPNDSGSGNAVGMLSAKLFTDVADPLKRLQAINRSTTIAKAGLERLPAAARTHQTAFATSPLMVQSMVGLAGRGGRPHANLVLSNVPGPAGPKYLGRAALDEVYPLSMLMHGQALNITAFSTGGRLNIGIVGCREKLPHLQKMATYLADALAELEASTERRLR